MIQSGRLTAHVKIENRFHHSKVAETTLVAAATNRELSIVHYQLTLSYSYDLHCWWAVRDWTVRDWTNCVCLAAGSQVATVKSDLPGTVRYSSMSNASVPRNAC